ncbi:MAG: DNA repair protein RadA, partial [Proteobacteria bacterium]
MAKTREVFVCDQCGGESLKWQGQCPACGAWNSLGKLVVPRAAASAAARPRGLPTQAGGEPPVLSQVPEGGGPRMAAR